MAVRRRSFVNAAYGGRRVVLFVGGTEDEARERIRREFGDLLEDGEPSAGFHYEADGECGKVSVIWVGGTGVEALAGLVHELAHAAVAIMSGAGVPVNAENDESLAYLMGDLTRECLKVWSPPTRRGRVKGRRK